MNIGFPSATTREETHRWRKIFQKTFFIHFLCTSMLVLNQYDIVWLCKNKAKNTDERLESQKKKKI